MRQGRSALCLIISADMQNASYLNLNMFGLLSQPENVTEYFLIFHQMSGRGFSRAMICPPLLGVLNRLE